MSGTAPRVAMVAGETSGDLLGALLLGGLRGRWPALQAMGIGGPRMAAAGFAAWWPHDKLAVRGYVEVLRHYREIVGIRRDLAARLIADPPDLFVGVDAPDFNLDLELSLRRRGIRTAHFISPSIWAWRPKRIEKIRAAAGHVLCVFPFEPALYERSGVPASYVGHPLADVIPLDPPRAAAREALGLGSDETVVALLPGSRRSEIEQHAGLFAASADVLLRRRPHLRFVLPAAPSVGALVKQGLASAGPSADRITVLEGRSHEALAACDVAVVASGTATLEAALFKRPMVIAYRMNALSWQLMKRQRLQPWVGLPNILLERFAVPELLQGDATPEALADATLAWLDDPARRDTLARDFRTLHERLRRNTARAATDVIAQLLGWPAPRPVGV
jgi:lipid-A-disaccharide synthase